VTDRQDPEPTDRPDPAKADPVQPTQPADRAEPADPAEPTEPADPVKPAEPVDPAKSVEPVEQTASDASSRPAESAVRPPTLVVGSRKGERRWSVWPILGVVATLLFCAAPVVGAVALVDRLPTPSPPTTGPPVAVSTGPPASPLPGDPLEVTQAWLRAQIAALLEQQAAALLAGDERGFLAVAAPGSAARDDLARQFRTLRAMQVTAWQPSISTMPTAFDSDAASGATTVPTLPPAPTGTRGPTSTPGPATTLTAIPTGAATASPTGPVPVTVGYAQTASPDPTVTPDPTVSATPSGAQTGTPPTPSSAPTGSPGDGLPQAQNSTEWRLLVSYQHCFVVPNCRTSPVVVGQRWSTDGDRLQLVAVEPSLTLQDGPRPWEVSELVVAAGNRTLVATTAAYRELLPGLLRDAEEAAVVADRYAVSGTAPDRYRIFYAGADEWKRWYGGDRPEWTAGYAVAVGGGHYEVVLNGTNLRDALRPDLLRHELTHAASLPDGGHRERGAWWLIEGLAEHAAAGGRPVVRYDGLANVRRLVLEQDWQGPLSGVEPAADAENWEVSAGYGVGYLAVRHLVDRFGEERTLAFFHSVVHDGLELDAAALREFGEPWERLHQACVDYVRQAAG
jgi:hypothetical protein